MTVRFSIAGLLPAALTLLMLGCGPDNNITRLYPDIATAPESLDFGQVRIGDEGALIIQVVNAGRGPLAIGNIDFEPPLSSFDVSPALLDVAAESSAEIFVTFEPEDLSTVSTSLLMGTNDPETPLVTIPVTATGIEGGPDISLDIDVIDFGSVSVGETGTGVFTIENVGDEDLEINTSGQQSGSGAFALLSDPRGEVLAPGGSFPVLVAYAPHADDGDLGSLSINSNDPDDPAVSVGFVGNGGGTATYPVALISGTSESEPGDTIILDGSASYDPDGNEPLIYAWTLVEQPEASTSMLSSTTLSAPFLLLDTAGSYTVALEVENTLGVESATTVHTVSAVPEEDIYVVLSWDTDDADLDLHLLDTDITSLWDGTSDCCWCNSNPDWGTAGLGDDDPLLAQDADGDGGPESILMPAPADGEYFARVHYYQDNGDGPTEATVRIYLEGELVDHYRRELRHNQIWDVAYVRWPQGYVIEENADPYTSEVRACAL